MIWARRLLSFALVLGLPLDAQRVLDAESTSRQKTAQLPRYELGIEAADLRTGCIGLKNCGQPSAALGVGGALNLNARLAVVGDWVITPSAASSSTNVFGGRESELLAGVRGELRARRFGYFAEAKAGYLHWNHVTQSATFTTPADLTFNYGRRTDFVVVPGAGVEYSLTQRLHIRGTMAALFDDYGGQWTDHLQPSVGMYCGLGAPVDWAPPVYHAHLTHRFFDSQNIAALSVGELGTTADTVTTQQFTYRGYVEGDPVVRPLVKYGLLGMIALQGIEVGLELAGMYGFHRLHQHWAERAVPLAVGTVHGVVAYQNTQHYSRSVYLH